MKMILKVAAGAAFAMLAGLAAAVPAPAAQPPAEPAGLRIAGTGLFQDAPGAPRLGGLGPWELRHRAVRVDRELLRPLCAPSGGGAPDALTLNLFADTEVIAEADHVGFAGRRDTVRWRGSLDGEPESKVTLTATGLCGGGAGRLSLAGSVRFNGEEYAIQPLPGGLAEIIEIDTVAAGMLQRPKHPDENEREAMSAAAGTTASAGTTGASSDAVLAERSAGRANPVIDALILYTPGAQKAAGGANAIQSWIEDAATRANDNLHHSGVRASVRIVHMELAKGYRGGETVEPAFDRLTKFRDGHLDQAPKLRDRYGADIVTTVVKGYSPKTFVAGLASYPERPHRTRTAGEAYSVVAADQLWAYVLGHEWGHLFGLDHDWRTSPERNPYYPDNHGYSSPSESFVTIMGYPSACSPPCQYVDYFATPNRKYEGERLGVKLGTRGKRPADGVRVMNATAPQLAAYRGARRATPDRDLRLATTPAGAGTASTRTAGPYAQGDAVSVTVNPKPGHVFAGWTLDGRDAGTADPLRVTMDRDHKLTARFAKGTERRNRLVTGVSPARGGEVTLNPGRASYSPDARVVASANAEPGYDFAGWLLDGRAAGDRDSITVAMGRAHRLVARFVPSARLTVTIRPGIAGDVAFDNSTPSGGDVVVQAKPARGWALRSWQLDGRTVGHGPVKVLSVSGDQRLTANFRRVPAKSKKIKSKAKKHKKKAHKKKGKKRGRR